jgi:NAD(P)-dependent dehydrogenase (short-subunit alcohol dehydrogenase family)
VRLLARDGAAVLIADLSSETGQQLSKEIGAAGGQAEFVKTDVSDPDSIHAMVGRAVERFGKLNLAANVAGVPQQPHASGWDHPPAPGPDPRRERPRHRIVGTATQTPEPNRTPWPYPLSAAQPGLQ